MKTHLAEIFSTGLAAKWPNKAELPKFFHAVLGMYYLDWDRNRSVASFYNIFDGPFYICAV